MAVNVNSALPLSPVQMADRVVATRNGVGGVLLASDMLALVVGALAGKTIYLTLAEAVADATLLNGKVFIVIDVATAAAAIHKRDTAVSTAMQPKVGDVATPSLVAALIAASRAILYATPMAGSSANIIRMTGISQTELISGRICSMPIAASNTGAVKLFMASIGEDRPFKMPDGTELAANTLRANQPPLFTYNSVTGAFHLIAPLPTSVSDGGVGDGGGSGPPPDFVTLAITAQTLNKFTLASAKLPTTVGGVALAWVLEVDAPLEGGWSIEVVGHAELGEERALSWPDGDAVVGIEAGAGQLAIAFYDPVTGIGTLHYPSRPVSGGGGNTTSTRDQFLAAQNAQIAAIASVENAEAIETISANLLALGDRTSPDAYIGDEYTLDFANGHYSLHGERVWGIKSAPGMVYTRTGVKGELDNGKIRMMEATNPAIIKGQGYWSRKAVTNLLLNSALLATQNVTVTAVLHTISFFGTGTVTLSGVSTAGPLVGTGRRNRVKLSFTPTAGALTVTVSGDVQMASLVIGDSEGPIIQTLGATVAVAADALTLSAALDDEPWFAFVVADLQQAGVIARLMVFDDGTNPNRITIGRGSNNVLSAQVLLNNVAQTVVVPADVACPTGKVAVGIRRDAAGKFTAAYRYPNGTVGIGVPGAAAGMLRGIRRLSVGHYSSGEQPQSPISLVRIIRGDLTDAQITAFYGKI